MLGELKIDLAPLIAGAGIAGIAIGFGAQSLVRDFLAGLLRARRGPVRRRRHHRCRPGDGNGRAHLAPGDAAPRHGGHGVAHPQRHHPAGRQQESELGPSRGRGHGRSHRRRASARAAMSSAAAEMATEDDWAPAMRVGGVADDQGISALTPMGVTLRLVVDTEPKSQWTVERELRLRIKEAFDAAGIPFEVHQPPQPMS